MHIIQKINLLEVSMLIIKNKTIYIILLCFFITTFIPILCYGNDTTSFVWSDISNPTLETVASLTKDKRKFFKSYLWWCNFN